MSLGAFPGGEDFELNPEINTTPLVDVMLVLLIIFIITVPVMTHSVQLDLPRASNRPNLAQPGHVDLSVDARGDVWWNGYAVDRPALKARIAEAAAARPQPELHIHADSAVRYEHVARVMADAQRGGLLKIGFVTQPEP